jgi:hypothetical protein
MHPVTPRLIFVNSTPDSNDELAQRRLRLVPISSADLDASFDADVLADTDTSVGSVSCEHEWHLGRGR